jgi:hypothetical protein
MKKTIIFAASFLMLTSLGVNAQKVHFGVKAGMNASSLNFEGNDNMQTKIGFNAGILAHIHSNSAQWGFQPELYYSSEGAKNKSNSDASLNLGYLNVPVLVQYMFDNGFRIEAGPQVGFLLSAKSKVGDNSEDVKDGYKGTAFSVPVGVGYLTHSGLGFDARYNIGVSNIVDNDGPSVKSNVFQFGIFYQFSDPKISQ